MEAQELRIGNYVYTQSGKLVVNRDSIYKVENVNMQSARKYEPIPLTEEWLLNFGFHKREDQKYYHLKFDKTWVSLDSILVKLYGNALGGIRMLDYVHQLQNLFFALTGEELQLNKIQ